MERGFWNRVGPIAGVLFVAAFFAAFAVIGVAGPDWVSTGAPAGEIAAYLEEQRDALGIAPAVLMGFAVVFFVVFLSDLHQRYRQAIPETSRWLATTFLAGGLLVAAGVLIHGALQAGAWAIADFGDNVQAAVALHAVTANAGIVAVPGLVLLTGAAATASFRFRALPRWLGVLAVIALLVAIVQYWVPVWLLWALGAAIVLLVNPRAVDASHTPQRAAAPD